MARVGLWVMAVILLVGTPVAAQRLSGGTVEERQSAVAALRGEADPAAVTALIAALEDAAPAVRMQAARSLGAMAAVTAIPALARSAADPAPTVSEAAIDALGRLRDPAAVEALLAVLRDAASSRQALALAALARQQDPAALETVLPFLQHSAAALRVQAAVTLGAMRDDRATAPLCAALADADATVRLAALQALEAIDIDTAQDQALALIRDPQMGDAAVQLLAKQNDRRLIPLLIADLLAPGPPPDLTEFYTPRGLPPAMVNFRAIHPLMTFGGRACEALQAAIRAEPLPARRLALLSVLGLFSGRQGADALAASLEDADAHVREYAAVQLGVQGDARGLHLLVALRTSPVRAAREAAVKALLRVDDPAAVGALTALAHDPSVPAYQRLNAINTLAGIARDGDRAAIAFLSHAIIDPDPAFRRRAVTVSAPLGIISDPATIVAELSDPVKEVRQTAMGLVASTLDPRLVSACLPLLTHPTADIRLNGITALGLLQDPRGVPALLTRLRVDADAGARAKAAGALGAIGDPSAAPALAQTLMTDRAAGVRAAAVTALAQIDGRAWLRALAYALRDADAGVRNAATDALRTLGDRRAVPHLVTAYRYAKPKDRPRIAVALWALQETAPLDWMGEMLRDGEEELAIAAANALAEMDDVRAVAPLCAGVLRADALPVNAASLAALSRLAVAHPDEAAFDPAVAQLTPVLTNRFLAAHTMNLFGKTGRTTAAEALVAYLDGRVLQGPVDVNQALEALLALKSPLALPYLRALAEKADNPVNRLSVILKLAQVGDAAARAELDDIVREGAANPNYGQALRTLTRIGDDQAVATLLRLWEVRDNRPQVLSLLPQLPKTQLPHFTAPLCAHLQATPAALPQIGPLLAASTDPRATMTLLALLRTTPSVPQRRQLLDTLADIGDPLAIPTLSALTLHPHHPVRNAARRALAKITAGDPR